MLCLCTPNQHTVHQQFLVLERTCRFHCCFCFTFSLHSLSLIRDTVERILCNDYPFQNLISHFTRFLFVLVFVLNRDGFFIRKHSVFVFFLFVFIEIYSCNVPFQVLTLAVTCETRSTGTTHFYIWKLCLLNKCVQFLWIYVNDADSLQWLSFWLDIFFVFSKYFYLDFCSFLEFTLLFMLFNFHFSL